MKLHKRQSHQARKFHTRFTNFIKGLLCSKPKDLLQGGLTVLISVLIIFTIAKAGSLTPSASPAATSYTLGDIYARLTTNATATEKNHNFAPSASPVGTLYTLTQIYNAIPTIDGAKVLSGTSYLGIAGTMADKEGDNASTVQSAAAGVNYFTAPAGFYDGDDRVSATDAQIAALDADIATGNIKSGATIFGIDGNGNVVDTSSGDAAAGDLLSGKIAWVDGVAISGTYNVSNLSVSNVRYGQSFGVSSTGTMSPYPNTPSGISGLNQTVCTAASWTWVADSNYDGISDDPICVNPNREAATKVWNTSVGSDNTFIGNYGCSGDTDGDGSGTLNTALTGTVSENDGYGDDAAVALAIADYKDGVRNLLSKAEVESSGYTAPDTSCTAPNYDDCYNGPLTPKALLEWKGTRLPSYNDFFGVCGNATTSKTWGQYGTQIGRTDNVITANIGTWEWLSELHSSSNARVAGSNACSAFNNIVVTGSYGLRVVFRP